MVTNHWVQEAVIAEVPKSLMMVIHSFLSIGQNQYIGMCFSVEFLTQETLVISVDYGIQMAQ